LFNENLDEKFVGNYGLIVAGNGDGRGRFLIKNM